MAGVVAQNQFLGSRISLVSKSEIRYEGILYALDLCEATISLAKGLSIKIIKINYHLLLIIYCEMAIFCITLTDVKICCA